MKPSYQSLPVSIMPVATTLSVPVQKFAPVHLSDPAVNIMTDLSRVTSVTINAGDGLHDAEYKMKKKRVKLLFVVDHNDYIIGVLTANDIYGKKLQQMQSELGIPVSEICILDMMTGIDHIDVLPYEMVLNAQVGDIIKTLQQLKRQHALVLEEKNTLKQIRGIFSFSQIKKLLIDVMETDMTADYNDICESKLKTA